MSRWFLVCCVSILWVSASGCVATTATVEALSPGGRLPTATETASPAPQASFALAQPVVPTNTGGSPSPSAPSRVRTGIEVLVEDQPTLVEGKRVGLITNPTGVGADLRSDLDLLSSVPGTRVVALFAGEHGLRGAEQAGKRLEGSLDPYAGVPVYSLYGSTLTPRPDWLRGLDLLVFDIQSSGSALYTYKYTMSFAMEAAANAGVPFIVLDRPNPAGGQVVEGPMLRARDIWRHPLPVRHGMTSGELATMWNEEYGLGAQLTVVKMDGWQRSMTWEETGLPWVAPSPNLPTADTALAYAGQALIETVTNVAEGRGTTKPFLVTGAPWVDAVKAAADLNRRGLSGVMFRPAYFQPTKPGEKFYGEMAGGVEIYFTDRRAYRAVLTTLSILDAYRASADHAIELQPEAPVEDIGSPDDHHQKVDGYQAGIQEFLGIKQKYLMYPE